MVCCDLCKNKFTAAYEGASQCGDGCSAEVVNGHLVGGYGSQIADGVTYRLTDSSTLREKSIVCDNCIRELIDSEVIVEETDMMNPIEKSAPDITKTPAVRLGDFMEWSDISEWLSSVLPPSRCVI